MGQEDATLAERLEALNQRIDESLKKALRNRSGLTLVPVSKRQPLHSLEAAYALGIRHFGESLIQEAILKIHALPDDITWHFIGHLQKNKVRKAVNAFTYIHSVHNLALLHRIDDIATQERVCPNIFLQVNLALDPDKYGVHPDAVATLLGEALERKHVTCLGLMGIPPLHATPQEIDEFYLAMASLRDDLKKQHPDWPGLLSLGMSNDFESAIAAGSNFIRVGTVLFGERQS